MAKRQMREQQQREVQASPLGAAELKIRSIRVLCSGSAEAHPEHQRGTWLPQWWWVLTSRSWMDIPVSFFLIEHRDGLVLFDTGLDPAIETDPDYVAHPIGKFLLKKIFRFHIGEEDQLDRQLRDAGFRAEDVKKAVFSHLHFDHVGGIAHIPQAELIVSRQEWDVLRGSRPEREWILCEHIEIPHANWHSVEFTSSDDPVLEPFAGCHGRDARWNTHSLTNAGSYTGLKLTVSFAHHSCRRYS